MPRTSRPRRPVTLSTERDFVYWAAQGTVLLGWALAAQGQHEESLRQIQQGLADHVATEAEITRPYHLVVLAETYGKAQQPVEGLRMLDESQRIMEAHGERWWEAELYRCRGELLLNAECGPLRGATKIRNAEWEPEACFLKALEVARRQQAKSWELRAAMSLSRLWRRQGKRNEARQVLAEIYGWFTEGFGTADLREARGFLDELG